TRQGVHAVVEQLAADPEGLRLFPQPPAKAASLRRPTAEDLRIDWQQPAVQIKDLVRAANPDYGGATTSVRGVPVALLQATVLALPEPDALPGTVVVAETPKPPVVRCGDGRGLQLDIVASDAGVQTGHRFAATIGLSPGERFI